MGAVAITGCSQLTGGDDGPAYGEDLSKEDLLLLGSDFPDGWYRDDSINDNFDAVFLSEDDSIIVMLSVGIRDSVDQAKSDFEDTRDGFRDPQEIDIGDEAFWDTREQAAYATVRHSNALGQAVSGRESGTELLPDPARAQTYAGEMYDHWQSL